METVLLCFINMDANRDLRSRELRGVYCTQTIAQLCDFLFHMATNVHPYVLAFRVF